MTRSPQAWLPFSRCMTNRMWVTLWLPVVTPKPNRAIWVVTETCCFQPPNTDPLGGNWCLIHGACPQGLMDRLGLPATCPPWSLAGLSAVLKAQDGLSLPSFSEASYPQPRSPSTKPRGVVQVPPKCFYQPHLNWQYAFPFDLSSQFSLKLNGLIWVVLVLYLWSHLKYILEWSVGCEWMSHVHTYSRVSVLVRDGFWNWTGLSFNGIATQELYYLRQMACSS